MCNDDDHGEDEGRAIPMVIIFCNSILADVNFGVLRRLKAITFAYTGGPVAVIKCSIRAMGCHGSEGSRALET